jgi:mycofactocin system glycosyltransferase
MNPATDPPPAAAGPVPPGTRLILDTRARRYRSGRILLGGSPARLLRLSPAAAQHTGRWLAGEPVGPDPRDARLARRLLDTGLAHPHPGAGHYTARDVTLVVPVKDNPIGVARVLTATTELTDRIVVDDGSTAALPQATVRHTAPRGPAAARNTGWRLARTDLVAFLDADTQPEPGWLNRVLPLFDDPNVAAVAPRVRSRPGITAVARYEHNRSSLDMGPDPGPVRPMSRISYVPTAALIVHRSAMTEVDGFDENLRYGEDVDLIWRLTATGHTVRYQPASTVWHTPRPTLRSWLRQRYDYGTSAAPLAHRHPGNLATARLTPSNALAGTLAATGHPAAALTSAVFSTTRLARDLTGKGVPPGAAIAYATQATIATAAMLAAAIRRTWWPLALLTPTRPTHAPRQLAALPGAGRREPARPTMGRPKHRRRPRLQRRRMGRLPSPPHPGPAPRPAHQARPMNLGSLRTRVNQR